MKESTPLTNLDRIREEIEKHAEELAPKGGMAASDIVRLLMEIVDLEDQHRVKAQHRVRKSMKGMIQNLARAHTSHGGT